MKRVIAAALLTALAGCADQPAQPDALTAEDAAQVFGACQTEGIVEFAPSVDFLASVERWIRLESASPSMSAEDTLSSLRPVTLVLDGREVSSAGEGELLSHEIIIHTGFLPGVTWTLQHGGTVALALGRDSYGVEQVIYAMVEPKEGPVFFPGGCYFDGMTRPLQQLLGERYSDLPSIVGMTQRATILKALGLSVSEPAPMAEVILSPEDAPKLLLASLDHVTLALATPASLKGPFTICTRIKEGWNDCMDLRSAGDPGVLLGAYVAEDLQLEVWLLDHDADVSSPIQMLARLDLTPYEDVIKAPNGGVIRLALGGKLESAGGRIIDPTAVVEVAETWDVLLRDPSAYEEVTGEAVSGDPG